MGKLLASQIHEGASRYGGKFDDAPSPPIKIRAVVRSEEEAKSVLCDLAGMVIVNGITSIKSCDWLETIVIGDVSLEENAGLLEEAFDGATYAVLCDASHNELVRSSTDGKWSMRVPAKENEDLSFRIMREIEAAAKCKSLEHVVLRSSMGLFLTDSDSKSDGAERTVLDEAIQIMGGRRALLGPSRAEEALRASKLDYTILRLGALTDDAGMIPLIFGTEDALLLKRMEGTTTRRPPMLSRADAARVAAFVLREKKSFEKKRLVVDCAWGPKWGRSSVGTEEAFSAASRQDLTGDILSACVRDKVGYVSGG